MKGGSRKINIEWIAHMGMYRISDVFHPEQTIAYESSLNEAIYRCIEEYKNAIINVAL